MRLDGANSRSERRAAQARLTRRWRAEAGRSSVHAAGCAARRAKGNRVWHGEAVGSEATQRPCNRRGAKHMLGREKEEAVEWGL